MSRFDMAAPLPSMPNELIIHIISYIDDPRFLWTVCRKVSPNFKKWSEEHYARTYLPKLQLEIHLLPLYGEIEQYDHIRTEYPFYLHEPSVARPGHVPDTAILKPRGPPFTVLKDHASGHQMKNMDDADFKFLAADRTQYQFHCQAYPELGLGLRTQSQPHICPCRSLKDQVRRGFCDRYWGTDVFLKWSPRERVFELRWKEFLDSVHAKSCRSPYDLPKVGYNFDPGLHPASG